MNTKLKFVLDVDVRVKKHFHKIHYCECKVPFLHRVWSTYRRSRQSREASLSTLTWQTHNTTRSNQTLRTWGTFRTLQSWDVKFRFTQDTKLKHLLSGLLTGGPSSPGSPFSPCWPGGPRSPASPCLPGGPPSPRVPFGPSLPAAPAGPTAPGLP